MTRLYVLALALLSSCSLFIEDFTAESCEDIAARCEGNVLVLCEGGFERDVDCGGLTCNAELAACGLCGDGQVQAELGELCDEGKANSNAGACNISCRETFCGDNLLREDVIDPTDPAFEQCDDGNVTDEDGCSALCLQEFCGDSVIQANLGEQCDDGNNLDTDNCEADCSLPECGNNIIVQEGFCFFPPLVLDAISQPVGVEVGDLDNDGNLDAAISPASTSAGLPILFGNGDGTFTRQFFPVGILSTVAGPLQISDFNGDSALDLILPGNAEDPRISVLLNNGSRSFSAPMLSQQVSSPSTLLSTPYIGDFDENDTLDLVVPSFDETEGVHFLTGQGDGSFQFSNKITIPGQIGIAALISDFNNDDNQDALLFFVRPQCCVRQAKLLLGDGVGSFSDVNRTLPLSFNPRILARDINNDDIIDLIDMTFILRIHLGQGDGNFLPLPDITLDDEHLGFKIEDINADGHLDIVASRQFTGNVSVFLGQGDGTFPEVLFLDTGNIQSRDVGIGDFNNDGALDVFVTLAQVGVNNSRLFLSNP